VINACAFKTHRAGYVPYIPLTSVTLMVLSRTTSIGNHFLVMKIRALPGYQINLLPLSTRPQSRTTVGVDIHISAPSWHDGPAWRCTGALCPCICRQSRRSISACQNDELIANGNV